MKRSRASPPTDAFEEVQVGIGHQFRVDVVLGDEQVVHGRRQSLNVPILRRTRVHKWRSRLALMMFGIQQHIGD